MNRVFVSLSILALTASVLTASDAVVSIRQDVVPIGEKTHIVSIYLENIVPVHTLQFEIQDLPNYLQPDSVWATKRARGFNISSYDDTLGVFRIILFALAQTTAIAPDTGKLLNIRYTISEEVQTEQALDIVFIKEPTLVNITTNSSEKIYSRLSVSYSNGKFLFTTDVEQPAEMDYSYQLMQNYPNPFNPSTTISFAVPAHQYVKLEIFNSIGQKIRTLVNKEYTRGVHQVHWDGTNEQGEKVSAGAYFYRIKADDYRATKQLLLVR